MKWVTYLVSGWKSRESVPKLVEEYMNKGLMVDEFVSHTMPLEEVNEAFDLMHAGKRWVLYEPRHEKCICENKSTDMKKY